MIDDAHLAAIITAQEASASSYTRSDLSGQRARALKYYLGEPFGNEIEGQSQVVSTDVFEAVEGMLPALLEIFLASNKLAECEPYGPEDEEEARQQTEVANHIIFKQNNALLIFYTWFKDALIQKTGIVKTYYETEDEYRIEQYQGLTDEEMTRLLSDENVEPQERIVREIVLQTEQGPVPVNVNDLRVKVRHKRQKVCIKNIPPENFLVSARQTSLDLSDCEFCTHKEKKTYTDLIEMGVEPEFLENIGDDGSESEYTEERIARDLYNDTLARDPHTEDESMREYWVSDGIIMVDADEDGVAEYRHFIKIGSQVWLNEETDYNPFSVICPIPLTHQFFGLSVADITSDVQYTKSTLWRQMLNNLYLTNNPRSAVLEGQVNMDDLLTSRPGGVIRQRVPNAVQPQVIPFVAKESFPMLEYWDTVREGRTGVTRYNQGMDADSLNKTATGVTAILGQSLKRTEMVARIFADTGIKDLVKKVLHCVTKSGMKQVILKLTNGYVHVDPREWKNQYNITVNVGLGTGTKDRVIQMLSLLSGKQAEMIQLGRGYMVSEQNQYNLATKLAEAAGFKNPELFFTDPRAVPPEAKQPPPPIDILKLQHDEKMKTMDMQVTSVQKDKDMANERWIAALNAQSDKEAKIAVAQITKAAQENTASIAADTQKRTKMADVMMKDHEIKSDAEIEVFKSKEKKSAPINISEAMMEGMSFSMDNYMQQLIEAVVKVGEGVAQGNQQNQQGFQAMTQELQQLRQLMVAPRKRVKDASGKTIGVEIDGSGVVPIQ